MDNNKKYPDAIREYTFSGDVLSALNEVQIVKGKLIEAIEKMDLFNCKIYFNRYFHLVKKIKKGGENGLITVTLAEQLTEV